MEELAGSRIEWWAQLLPGGPPRRVRAVLLGTAGAVFADPLPGDEDDYLVTCYEVEPGSLVRVSVVSRPKRPRRPFRPWTGRGLQRVGPDTLELEGGYEGATIRRLGVEGLTDNIVDVLETLPPQATDLLTSPFHSDPVLQARHHYEGVPDRLDIFGIVIVGRRELTLATGSRLIPNGHTPRTAHWALTCARARVTRRLTR
jgi:hypothetical protein